MKRGQSATEMLLILAVGLVVLIYFISINSDILTSSQRQVDNTKAKAVVEDLARGAELVYKQGVGAKTRVFISIPENTNFIQFDNRTVRLNYFSPYGDTSDVIRSIDFDATGFVDSDGGNRWVSIESYPGFVLIGNGSDTFPPKIINVRNGSVTNESADILWVTNELADSKVYYGIDDPISSVSDFQLVLSHQLGISNLIAHTVYNYIVESCDFSGSCANSSIFTFKTNYNPSETYPLIFDVTNESTGNDSVGIFFKTDIDTNAQIDYGVDSDYFPTSVINNTIAYSHKVALSDLDNLSTYYFNVTACSQFGLCNTTGPFSFTTTQNIPPPQFLTVFSDDFEDSDISDWDTSPYNNWDVWSYNGSKRIHAAWCQAGTTAKSQTIDLSTYTDANLSFWWSAYSLDSAFECLWFQFENSTYTSSLVIDECGSPTREGQVNIDIEDYIALSSDLQLRITCSTSSSFDHVYIDDFEVVAR